MQRLSGVSEALYCGRDAEMRGAVAAPALLFSGRRIRQSIAKVMIQDDWVICVDSSSSACHRRIPTR